METGEVLFYDNGCFHACMNIAVVCIGAGSGKQFQENFAACSHISAFKTAVICGYCMRHIIPIIPGYRGSCSYRKSWPV